MDTGALWATVHGVAKESDTIEQLSTAQHSLELACVRVIRGFLGGAVVKNPPANA